MTKEEFNEVTKRPLLMSCSFHYVQDGDYDVTEEVEELDIQIDGDYEDDPIIKIKSSTGWSFSLPHELSRLVEDSIKTFNELRK